MACHYPGLKVAAIGRALADFFAVPHQQGLSELRIETMPRKDKTEIRYQVSGVIKLG